MNDRGWKLNTELCSMPAEAADKLIARADGDCALLYIYLMRRGNSPSGELCRALRFPPERLAAAAGRLRELGLLSGGEALPGDGGVPQYTAAEIVSRSESDEGFRSVLAECESVLGHTLSGADTRTLFGIYDYLGLPTDVIMVLLHHCAEECRRRYGPGRVPTMRQIEKEAYAWVNREIMTLEQAEAYIRERENVRSATERVRRILGITDRKLAPTERRYIEDWLSLGLSVEVMELAYDRTVTNTGSLRWSYMDKVLRSWLDKGLTTVQAITERDGPPRRRSGGDGDTSPTQEDMDRMRRLYERLKNS